MRFVRGFKALAVVNEIMMKKRVSPGDEIKLRAANSIMDRILGKAPQSMHASVTQRTVAADGTIIEGSVSGGGMMSPLLQAAQAHLAQEEVRRLNPPASQDTVTRRDDETGRFAKAAPSVTLMSPSPSVQGQEEPPMSAPSSSAPDRQSAAPASVPSQKFPTIVRSGWQSFANGTQVDSYRVKWRSVSPTRPAKASKDL